MCDNGRLNTFKHVNADTRIESCFIKKEGKLNKTTWVETLEVASKSLKDFKSSEIAFVASPYATVEDNFVLQKFAKQYNPNNIFAAKHIIPGDQDGILIREDKTPNSAALELLGIKNEIEKLSSLIENKNIKALIVMEEDLASISDEWATTLAKLELLIVMATNKNKTTELADIIFPAATYAEKHGTFVNFQGRVQRIRPAVATEELDRALDGMNMSRWDKFGTKFDRWMQGKKYDAKPSWKIFALLDNYSNNKIKYKMAEEVFEDLAKTNDAFKGLDYDVIGELGVQLKIYETQNA
jgi:NADH-quinone oxidoreductase subunit G